MVSATCSLLEELIFIAPELKKKNPVKFIFHLSHDGNTRGLYFGYATIS